MIIKNGIQIDLELVKKKCEQSGAEFDIIKMFSNAKKLKNRWDEDMLPLLSEEISFQEVMKTLSKYFKLKEKKQEAKELRSQSDETTNKNQTLQKQNANQITKHKTPTPKIQPQKLQT